MKVLHTNIQKNKKLIKKNKIMKFITSLISKKILKIN